jgi:hypothetical protein
VAAVGTLAIGAGVAGTPAAGQTAQGFHPSTQPYTVDEFGFAPVAGPAVDAADTGGRALAGCDTSGGRPFTG